MQRLQTPQDAAQWLRAQGVCDLRTDHRTVSPGDALLAWPGVRFDARGQASAVLAAGAMAVLMEAKDAPAASEPSQRVAAYEGLKRDAGRIAAAFYGEPSAQMQVVAVTGTNGKTSAAWWLAHAMRALGCPTAVCGTLGLGLPDHLQTTGLTTPDPVQLQRELAALRDAGVRGLAIEASSVGLVEGRLAGLHIDVAVLTNFTQDHLDYHGSMDAYWAAKAALFNWPSLRAAVLNLDDPKCEALARALEPAAASGRLDLWTFALGRRARAQARSVRPSSRGMQFEWAEASSAGGLALDCPVVGRYNVSNLMAVAACLRVLGHAPQDVAQVLPTLPPVPGRMEAFGGSGAPLVVVDYAHTPDALEKALQALQPVRDARGGRLHVVFGCGGDRDPIKRPLMGAVAEARADQVHVTSDNPRSERPEAIVSDVLRGMSRAQEAIVEPDRARAIAQAVSMAGSADVVLVAGKGHEAEQEIAGQRLPFRDQAHVQAALRAWMVAQPMMRLADVLALLLEGGVVDARQVGANDIAIVRVHTDTRSVQAGDLFVALRGERFDGHAYGAQAFAAGAVAVLAEHGRLPEGVAGIEVPDTLVALGALAAAWRARWSGWLVAVTGSNGKTTVTQMLAGVLRTHAGDASLATQGNFNNEIGLPLTLLRLRPWHRVAVAELGMNHPGEIARLARIARPNVALVNNAQREHQEFMHSVEAVALENGAVFGHLAENGVAVFPAQDEYTSLWRGLAQGCKTIEFGDATSAVHLIDARWSGQWDCQIGTSVGRIQPQLRIAGRHNLHNALAATACALALAIPSGDIERGLSGFGAVGGRSRALRLAVGARTLSLVDDSYNANPDSVRAAIDVLADLPAPRLLVLGDMGEVGEQGPQFHAEAGQYAAQHRLDRVYTLGVLSRACEGQHFEDMDSLIAAVRAALGEVNSVLVKGSRFMKMERVVQALIAQPPQAEALAHVA